MLVRLLLLIVGVYACSTAVIMIKMCQVHPVLLAGYRLLIAAAVLAPLMARDARRVGGHFTVGHLRRTVLPGLVLALHFVSWIIGARLTPAANSSLIVNMVPLVMPLMLYALARETLTRGEAVGTALAVAGLAALTASDFNISAEHFLGDVLCFVSMLFFALYLALGRRNRDFPSVWLYLVPLYAVAGLSCTAAGAAVANPFGHYSAMDAWMILGLGLVPTVLGHSILNLSMRHFRGQTVGIANLGQFVFAGVMGFFWLRETPSWSFYAASALIVAGAVIALRAPPDSARR